MSESDSGKLGSAVGGPGSIAAADTGSQTGTKGIASGGLDAANPVGSRVAGQATPIVPGGTTGSADAQPNIEGTTGASGGPTNDSEPGGAAVGDTKTPNAAPDMVDNIAPDAAGR